MKTKGLIALLLTTAVAVVVAVLVSIGGSGAATDPLAGKAVLPDVEPKLGDIARMTLVHGDNKTTLVRQGKSWGVEEKGGYPADATKLRQALLGLAELRYVEAKTRKPEFYPRLEVEDPNKKDAKSTLVTVSDDKGNLIGEIIAGKRRIDELGGGTDGVYVRKPGDAQSWLARGTLDLAGETTLWLDRKVVNIAANKVKEAVLTQPDGAKLDIVRDKPDGKFALKGAPADTKLKSDTVLVEPATALEDLDLADVRPAGDLPFPAEGVAHAEVTTYDGLTIKAALFEKDGKTWARFEASGTGDAQKQASALNAKLGRWVYQLEPGKAKALTTKLADVVAPPKAS